PTASPAARPTSATCATASSRATGSITTPAATWCTTAAGATTGRSTEAKRRRPPRHGGRARRMGDNGGMDDTLPACPRCGQGDTYPDGTLLVCPHCAHEWAPGSENDSEGPEVRDSNGNPLAAGDTVVVIKDLKVKGSSIPLKQGTVIRNIRLVDGD